MLKKLFTSESVTEGHPDKICDIISDTILDELLKNDPMSRVACEVCIKSNLIVIIGEITTNASININKIVKQTINKIGYTDIKYGFDYKKCTIIININKQSKDIAFGISKNLNIKNNIFGAGDQGTVYGFATNETNEFIPYPIFIAHKLAYQLDKIRKNKILKYLRPDGKTQVTVEYNKNNLPIRINNIVISIQHEPNITKKQINNDIKKYILKPIIPSYMIDKKTKFFINSAGRFVIGGPISDSGLTGRKIMVDTYGGYNHHGGGSFSGKDCTKMDRSAAYMARYIAKNIVAAKLCQKCEIQLSYAIGIKNPIVVQAQMFGKKNISEYKLIKIIQDNFDLTPAGIIKTLNLRKPIYKQTSVYGHFGRNDLNLPWEKLNKVKKIKKYL